MNPKMTGSKYRESARQRLEQRRDRNQVSEYMDGNYTVKVYLTGYAFGVAPQVSAFAETRTVGTL